MAGISQRSLAPGLLIGLWMATTILAGAQQLPEPFPASASDVQATYTRLLTAITKIPIFDNHGHPGFADDPDVDAMSIAARRQRALPAADGKS